MKASVALKNAMQAMQRYERRGHSYDRCVAEVWAQVAQHLAFSGSNASAAEYLRVLNDDDMRAFHRSRIMRCWDCVQARNGVMLVLNAESIVTGAAESPTE